MTPTTPELRATRRVYAATRYAKCKADPDIGIRYDAGSVRSRLRALAKRIGRHTEVVDAMWPGDAQLLAELLPQLNNDLNVLVALLHPSRRSAR